MWKFYLYLTPPVCAVYLYCSGVYITWPVAAAAVMECLWIHGLLYLPYPNIFVNVPTADTYMDYCMLCLYHISQMAYIVAYMASVQLRSRVIRVPTNTLDLIQLAVPHPSVVLLLSYIAYIYI